MVALPRTFPRSADRSSHCRRRTAYVCGVNNLEAHKQYSLRVLTRGAQLLDFYVVFPADVVEFRCKVSR